MTLIAVTRPVSSSLARCEISFIERQPIDVVLARRQHADYERALEAMGATLDRLPAADDQPDAVFVEDTALVLDELAVVPIMGAEARRAETTAVADRLARYRPLHRLSPPTTLDGGDVMQLERTIYVGLTARTNAAAVSQLQAALRPHGYAVAPIVTHGCLHLKSACTSLGRHMVLANPSWIEPSCFEGVEVLPVAPEEPFAANAAVVGGRLLYASGFPRTEARLRAGGFEVVTVDTAELRKAEAAITCMSLLFEG